MAQNIRVMGTCCDLSVELSEVRGGGRELFCVLKDNDVVKSHQSSQSKGSKIPEFPDGLEVCNRCVSEGERRVALQQFH